MDENTVLSEYEERLHGEIVILAEGWCLADIDRILKETAAKQTKKPDVIPNNSQ